MDNYYVGELQKGRNFQLFNIQKAQMTNKKTCTFFLSAKGCQYGNKCRNAHINPNTQYSSTTESAALKESPLTTPVMSPLEESDPIPSDFKCPISHEAMEYPYITTQGNSYEYGEIYRWLKEHNTDPKSGVILKSKHLVPNNLLRAQIIEWFETHKQYRKPAGSMIPPQTEPEKASDLSKILCYRGSKTVKEKKKDLCKLPLPQSFPEYEQTYFFNKSTTGNVEVSCKGGESIIPPESSMFLTSQGVVFFDPSEIRDTKVIPGCDDTRAPCKYGKICNKQECSYPHPFVCSLGATCPSQQAGCKFYHPDADSIVPLGTIYPLSCVCKYNVECSGKQCGYAHPLGRFTHKRETAKVLITHSHKLQTLESPIPLHLEIPDAAKAFQFQGDFVFFFVPYPGAWASKHYEKVIVHRFDKESQAHKFIGEYSLENHYCNCVAGAGKYFIISFWPFEEEAVRTIWDCLKIARGAEKLQRKKEKQWKAQLEKKDQEIQNLNDQIIDLRKRVSDVEFELAKAQNQILQNRKREQMRQMQAQQRRDAREEAARQKRQQYELEQKLRKEKRERERQMNERLRMRDPIHVYQLSSGTGTQQADWTLVVDYHKGAHGIKLDFDRKSECHSLEITENCNVFLFDLLFSDLLSIPNLPLAPETLCDGF